MYVGCLTSRFNIIIMGSTGCNSQQRHLRLAFRAAHPLGNVSAVPSVAKVASLQDSERTWRK
jgi:hypothetical protein